MDKMTDKHLNRTAYIYIRQSTLQQVQHNQESKRIQYGLANRAKVLGWHQVKIIDDDLGVSAAGKVQRIGFERLLSEICQGNVGAVFAMDASRLARNGREWHTLLELCALVKTLIIDLDAIYDPCLINDRLLLGMRGTISEMEVSLFRQRSEYALRQKAERGELYTIVAIGYQLSQDNKLEKDPNKRIQEAISLVFIKFRELKSVRQVLLWFREEKICLPATTYISAKKYIQWKLPVYNTILKILTNPVYAGSYAYGRTKTEVKIKDNRKKLLKGKRLSKSQWAILIHQHHEEYISWEDYEMNQDIIENNANMKGAMVRGSIKKGHALLTGLLRCGYCGRKMLVHYGASNAIRYFCKGARQNHGTDSCISFGGLTVDVAIAKSILEVISPLGIEAALQATEELEKENNTIIKQRELELQEARFEAERAKRQYDIVEPENRLVAVELENRWNQALEKVQRLEQAIAYVSHEPAKISAEEKQELFGLGKSLKQMWFSEMSSFDFKKQIVRTLLQEIIAKLLNDKIILILHWYGGEHTQIEVLKNKTGHHRWVTETETTKIIETLSRYMPDKNIAFLLSRLGKRTAKGHSWNESRVRTFRNDHDISAYIQNEHHARKELLLSEVAQRLKLSPQFVIRLIKKNILDAIQVCKGSPWIFKEKDVAIFEKKYKLLGGTIPLTSDSKQKFLDLSRT